MENIRFFAPKNAAGKVKCTIHRNGKLGFSSAAAKDLKVSNLSFAKFGQKSDAADTSLYMLITEEFDQECFKINKAGTYYYINTKALFDDMKIDYAGSKIIFDLFLMPGNEHIYKMIKREIKRKSKEQQIGT
jgi:hypothetical protein